MLRSSATLGLQTGTVPDIVVTGVSLASGRKALIISNWSSKFRMSDVPVQFVPRASRALTIPHAIESDTAEKNGDVGIFDGAVGRHGGGSRNCHYEVILARDHIFGLENRIWHISLSVLKIYINAVTET